MAGFKDVVSRMGSISVGTYDSNFQNFGTPEGLEYFMNRFLETDYGRAKMENTYDFGQLEAHWRGRLWFDKDCLHIGKMTDDPHQWLLDRERVLALSDEEKTDLIQYLFHSVSEKTEDLENSWDSHKELRSLADVALEAYTKLHRRFLDAGYFRDEGSEVEELKDEIAVKDSQIARMKDTITKLRLEIEIEQSGIGKVDGGKDE